MKRHLGAPKWREFEQATRLPDFIEEVYNRKRLHSALGYHSPNDFEDQFIY